MQSCPKCGTKTTDDASYCAHCGVALRSNEESTIEQQVKSFAKNMEQIGKTVGDQISQAAKKIQTTAKEETRQFEHRLEQINQHTENWYKRTFGVFRPLLDSFIFLIVFRVIIMIMSLPNEQTPQIAIIAEILLEYLLLFFALSLLSNYTGYFSKKSFRFKIFSPLFYAIFFVLFCWVLTRILYDFSTHFTIPELQTAVISLENSLPTIFVTVLLIGYFFLMINLPKEQQNKP